VEEKMETPIMINPSQIKLDTVKACIKTGIVCFLLGIAFDIIIGDSRVMNRPIIEKWYEATVFEQKWPTNIFDTKGQWISKGDPVALTPVKEK
jgi:hypothetical protein